MDLIVKTQEKQVTITVKGYLKAITLDDREIKFYISGENNIKDASDEEVDVVNIAISNSEWLEYVQNE